MMGKDGKEIGYHGEVADYKSEWMGEGRIIKEWIDRKESPLMNLTTKESKQSIFDMNH